MGQKIKQFLNEHWISSLIVLLIGTVSITYGVLNVLIITPKNEKIEELRDDLSKLEDNVKDIQKQEDGYD